MAGYIDLFDGLMKGDVQNGAGGYIFGIHFAPHGAYAILQITGFENVKNILQSGEGVTFQSDGYQVFVVMEPKTYTHRYMEPYLREDGYRIPLRWNELETLELPNKSRILVCLKPYISYGSFTIDIPESGSFVDYFYGGEDVDKNLLDFIGQLLFKDFAVPRKNVRTVQASILRNLESFHQDSAHDKEAPVNE